MNVKERDESRRHTGTYFRSNVDIADHRHPGEEADFSDDPDTLKQIKLDLLNDLQGAIGSFNRFKNDKVA
jgi:hypothetical protein